MKTDYNISELADKVDRIEDLVQEQIRVLEERIEFLEDGLERATNRMKLMRNEG